MPLGCVLLISKLYDEDLQIEFPTFTRGSKGSGGLSLCIFKYFHFQFSSNYSRLSVVFDPLRFSRTSSEILQFLSCAKNSTCGILFQDKHMARFFIGILHDFTNTVHMSYMYMNHLMCLHEYMYTCTCTTYMYICQYSCTLQ